MSSEDEFWRVIKLDLYGTFLCSRIGIPHMIKSGGGSIINMSSIVALKRAARARLLHRRQGRHRRDDALNGGRIRGRTRSG